MAAPGVKIVTAFSSKKTQLTPNPLRGFRFNLCQIVLWLGISEARRQSARAARASSSLMILLRFSGGIWYIRA